MTKLERILGEGGLLAATRTKAQGPEGRLPITPEMLLGEPSGNLFGMTQDAGMGWNPAEVNGTQALIISTQGGLREPDGRPVALGFHTGHWEIGLLVRAAAETLREAGLVPFAAYVSDPCDGRTQGTVGMFDSLPYRNDAAIIMRRLIRSLPRRAGVIGIATCDKGLPATMMALAGCGHLPGIVVPGGVTLPAIGGEDAGKIQSIGARFAHGLISLDEAASLGCRACGTPGGGCQFLGTAATSQVVAEAFGMTLPHSALCPVGRAGLARHGAPLRARAGEPDRSAGAAARRSSRRTRSKTRCSCTRRSADRPTCCCIFPRWRTPPGCSGRRSTTGTGSTSRRRVSSTRCPTARAITRPCRCSWPAAFPR